MSLVSVTYVSTATGMWDVERLKKLLEKSRANNSKNSITGLLLYSEGSFMQTFEGPDQEARALFGKIMRDPSHHGIITLFDEKINERSFKDWKMGFRDMTDVTEGYSTFLDNDDEKITDQALLMNNAAVLLMKSFRNRLEIA